MDGEGNIKKINNTQNIINDKIENAKIINKIEEPLKKSYYGSFVQKLLFSITFFSLCLYLIVQNLNSSNIPLVIMQTKIIHLIISLIFAVILGYMASIATLMIIPITGYVLTAIAKIMNNNFDITIKILC